MWTKGFSCIIIVISVQRPFSMNACTGWTDSAYDMRPLQLTQSKVYTNQIQPKPSSHTFPKFSYPASISYSFNLKTSTCLNPIIPIIFLHMIKPSVMHTMSSWLLYSGHRISRCKINSMQWFQPCLMFVRKARSTKLTQGE